MIFGFILTHLLVGHTELIILDEPTDIIINETIESLKNYDSTKPIESILKNTDPYLTEESLLKNLKLKYGDNSAYTAYLEPNVEEKIIFLGREKSEYDVYIQSLYDIILNYDSDNLHWDCFLSKEVLDKFIAEADILAKLGFDMDIWDWEIIKKNKGEEFTNQIKKDYIESKKTVYILTKLIIHLNELKSNEEFYEQLTPFAKEYLNEILVDSKDSVEILIINIAGIKADLHIFNL